MNTRKRARRRPGTGTQRPAPPSPEERRRAARRSTRWRRAGIVAALALAGWLTWPQLTLPFSGVAPIVADLRNDSVFVESGVTGVDEQQIREVLGRRPAAMIVLAQDSTFTDRPLDICTAVVERIDDIELMVSQIGEGFVTQCQGDDLPVLTTDLRFDAGVGYTLDRATRMFEDDVPGQAEQLALTLDAAVKGGRLADTERTFRAPATAWLLAGGTVVGVVGGAVVLFWGVRAGSAALVERRRRRAEFGSRYEDVETTVSEAALVLIAIDPQDVERTAAATELAVDYRAVLDDLENARTAGDLDALEPRIDRILADLRQVHR